MKPIKTPETNAELGAAEGDEDRVLPLPVIVRAGDPGVYSVWEPDAAERQQIAEGANVELGVAANPPPPVGMRVAPPHHADGTEMEWSDELKTWLRPVTEPE